MQCRLQIVEYKVQDEGGEETEDRIERRTGRRNANRKSQNADGKMRTVRK